MNTAPRRRTTRRMNPTRLHDLNDAALHAIAERLGSRNAASFARASRGTRAVAQPVLQRRARAAEDVWRNIFRQVDILTSMKHSANGNMVPGTTFRYTVSPGGPRFTSTVEMDGLQFNVTLSCWSLERDTCKIPNHYNLTIWSSDPAVREDFEVRGLHSIAVVRRWFPKKLDPAWSRAFKTVAAERGLQVVQG